MKISDAFIYGALVISVFRSYLSVNKIWIRKHERPVAESVSVIACMLALVVNGPYLVRYAMSGEILGALKETLSLTVTGIFFCIGSGFWVAGWRQVGPWQAIKKALRLEGTEWSEMLKRFARPKGASKVLRILRLVALVDRKLAEEEVRLVESFALHWGVPSPFAGDAALGSPTEPFDPDVLRREVEDYLALEPPPEQAGQLVDLVRLVIGADKDVRIQERHTLAEIDAMVTDYLDGDIDPPASHEVLVIPQGGQQVETFRQIFAGTEPIKHCGGLVYVVGRYHHEPYAEMVSSSFQQRKICSVVNTTYRRPPEH